MKFILRWLLILPLTAGWAGGFALADTVSSGTEAPPAPAPPVEIVDNLYLDATTGAERPPGEESTPFALLGLNWGIPLTPPDGVAWGLQLGANAKARDDDPEWNGTFGGFARNFGTFHDQQGAMAVLLDYRRTAFHNDLWALRPIIGTTFSPQDALGLEMVGGLDSEGGERIATAFNTFWTRDWTEMFTTELGLGYEFSSVDEAFLRPRVAVGLTRNMDVGFGGDINTAGDYAMGVSLSYHLGGTGRHASLHNIRGSGSGLYTPFPDADFPALVHRAR